MSDTHDWCFETVHKLGVDLADSREAVERLAEFASEMASDREDLRLIAAIEDEERIERLVDDSAALWRGLCHSRAVQLNEAYEKIAKLEDEVKFLQLTIDDMIVGESIK